MSGCCVGVWPEQKIVMTGGCHVFVALWLEHWY